jgi:hypothetical protein
MSARKITKQNIYNELNDLHKKATKIVDELEEVVNIYRSPIVLQSVTLKNKAETDGLVKTISDDIVTYRGKLEKLRETHSKWGNVAPKDENRFIECHDIGYQYLDVISTVASATTPMTLDVYKAISEGLTK